jgi:hypothetical protein
VFSRPLLGFIVFNNQINSLFKRIDSWQFIWRDMRLKTQLKQSVVWSWERLLSAVNVRKSTEEAVRIRATNSKTVLVSPFGNGETNTVLEFVGTSHKTHDCNMSCENDYRGNEQAASKHSWIKQTVDGNEWSALHSLRFTPKLTAHYTHNARGCVVFRAGVEGGEKVKSLQLLGIQKWCLGLSSRSLVSTSPMPSLIPVKNVPLISNFSDSKPKYFSEKQFRSFNFQNK